MVKQLALTVILTAGAVLPKPTFSHRRRAEGLGRFSGMMLSSEFDCQAGQFLRSLHLSTLLLGVSTANSKSSAIALKSFPTPNPSAIKIKDTPTTVCLFHGLSVFNNDTLGVFLGMEEGLDPEGIGGRLRKQLLDTAISSLSLSALSLCFNYFFG